MRKTDSLPSVVHKESAQSETRTKLGKVNSKVFTVFCEVFIGSYCQYHQEFKALNSHRHVLGIKQAHNGVGFGLNV